MHDTASATAPIISGDAVRAKKMKMPIGIRTATQALTADHAMPLRYEGDAIRYVGWIAGPISHREGQTATKGLLTCYCTLTITTRQSSQRFCLEEFDGETGAKRVA